MHPGGLAAAREAAALAPSDARLALAHGLALLEAERIAEAIAELQRALRLDYGLADARLALGRAWLEAGEPDRALEALSRLEEDGEVSAQIARAHAMKAQRRSDPGYVRHLFDQFAGDYDRRMIEQLGYGAPGILRELADLVMPGRERLAVLDLGCGTGLGGAAFADLAGRLDGVDLSPRMIEKARLRGIYDSLAVADIEGTLARDEADYDLMLAADTLVYLGALDGVFSGAARGLRPNGFFLFTVERKENAGFELGPRRRWRHSESYLRETAAGAGLAVAGLVSCVPRFESKIPVEGLAVALMRPA
ncbi:MAG TPA: methyltransferase domain-containing protein [Rhizomicrobium sp.]|jgi:predicted TPR repeat methyltransferase|nr:methyltransferase domain-containing protein [Rhizomicrobium sp.]